MKFLISLVLIASLADAYCQQEPKIRTLIVIFDGLRPDYITPDVMPHLYTLKGRGSYGLNHHSVFPTVTRVNASSYATGSYPATHGLLGNTVYFPEVDPIRGLNTGDAKELMRIGKATNDRLLTAVSLGELLQTIQSRMMVFSSGSSGQAFLQNHTLSGGAIVNPEVILPESFKGDVMKKIGPPPASSTPNTAQHDWATRAWIEYGLKSDGPLVSAIWFSDPDATAHDEGMGHPLAMEAIRSVDEQLGVITKTLEEKGLMNSFNIIVTADHGFVSHSGKISIQEFLVRSGLKQSETSNDIVVAGNALYIKDHDREVIKKVVSALQEQPWVGAMFTTAERNGSLNGWVQGTLSFESIHWDHTRAGDILVDYNWNNSKNSYGYEGTSFSKGVAGHGGSSPYEIHIPLVVYGPGFRSGFESALPTSNIDIVPTILHLFNIAIPPSMDGRVMHELLRESSDGGQATTEKKVFEVSVEHSWGTYKIILQRSVVGKQSYVDFTRVVREGVK